MGILLTSGGKFYVGGGRFHVSASGGGGGDETAPVLSSATGTATGTTTANGSVSTDEGNGTLYWVVTTSATSPSVAQVQAGQDHNGSAAADSGNQSVSATGTQNVSASGLTAATTYHFHFQQEDAATNDSTVASSSSFETDAAAGLNQTAGFGGDTLSGAGAYQITSDGSTAVTGVSDDGTGTASGYNLSAGGLITPSSNGALSAQDGNTIDYSSDQGSGTVTLDIAANAATVIDITELAAAESALRANSLSTDWTIYLRAGTYGATSNVETYTGQVMSGALVNANSDLASILADTSTYDPDDVASFSGGSIIFEAEDGAGSVTMLERWSMSGSSGYGFRNIDFEGSDDNTGIVSISGALGEFLFQGCTMTRHSSLSDPDAPKAVNVTAAAQVVIEDCEITRCGNAISVLDCEKMHIRRTHISKFYDDAMRSLNSTKSVSSAVRDFVCSDVIAYDRATGASHADNLQFGSAFDQALHRTYIVDSYFGPFAQGIFENSFGASASVDVGSVTGTFASGNACSYGPNGTEFSGTIRGTPEDLGGGTLRIQVERDANMTNPFPAVGDEINDDVSGASATVTTGLTGPPPTLSGIIENTLVLCDFGQGIGVEDSHDMLVRHCTVASFNGTSANLVSANAKLILLDTKIGAKASIRNIANTSVSASIPEPGHVEIDTTIASGATAYDTVFDAAGNTTTLSHDGDYWQYSPEPPLSDPAGFKTWCDATFGTSSGDAGYLSTIDRTKATLSSPTATSVSTDTDAGTLYWVVTGSATPPKPMEIAMGMDGIWTDGLMGDASDNGSQAVSGTGSQSLSPAPTISAGQWLHITQLAGEFSAAATHAET